MKKIMQLKILIVFCLFVKLYHGQIICASGRTSGNSNIGLNGEYTQMSSLFNGKPAYVRSEPSDCFPIGLIYLFVGGDDRYYFASNVGNTSLTYGRCNNAGAQLPTACNGWIIGSSSVDSDFGFSNGECPKAACGSIQIQSSNGSPPCVGNLMSTGVNTFVVGSYYFNFNQYWQRWQCVDASDVDICAGVTVFGDATSREFISISPGITTNIDWRYYGVNNSPISTQLSVTCVASEPPTAATPEPTRNPVKSATTDNLCLFGHTGAWQFVNGFYEYMNNGNDPYYVKNNADSDCGDGTSLYLYFANSKWYISDTIGKTDTSIYGVCNSAFTLLNPIDCNGLWQFAGGNSNAIITTGSCPTTGCTNGIDTSNPSAMGPFTEQVTQNNGRPYIAVYKNPSNDHYLYFNENDFRWEYSTNFQGIKSCITPAFEASTQAWFEFTNGETAPISWSNGQTGTISCYNGPSIPTKSPVVSPTVSPVGDTPTKSPVISPTNAPTMKPTVVPTKITMQPTLKPTESPYLPGTPSRAPSESSNSPTNIPTNNPVVPTTGGNNASNANSFNINVFIISFIFVFILFV
mmetsp:Transcript_63590/g.77780  ORF Transcript_63590/g.77780 Transcript_63590/m.77780 type:complete len:576 (+) Transcript_63590:25-1752(+)